MMKCSKPLLLISLSGLLLVNSVLYAAGVKKTIHFAPGKDNITLSGSVVRSDSDIYYVTASRNQTMNVSVSSLEDNAVFQIYLPDAHKTLAQAGELDDATQWSGKLPIDGRYQIWVGGTRGNASYKLTVKITH